ncbi:putative fungal pheromoneG-protein-coupled receptor [Daedalea quercina L-15889]|uniref:Putative fungal pheromoneG-protein-coupled receptor n=1 Tax=Daedalea quercina L-15889 TaxID=1314783 RepID=A0A165NRX4_9APHY|nr:putative fungal pheromoneG-protein-coupled receptor [Daedalea quercina L-15889]
MSDPWAAQEDVTIAFSFIGFVLVNVPMYWHLRAWNTGSVQYIFWVGSACLIQFINNIVWKDNAINWAPVWCDITTRWTLASSIAICSCSLVIMRRLYHIANITTIHVTREDKRRMIIEDIAVGSGFPILEVLLYWFMQGHRFDIYEGIGCWPTIPNTVVSWFIYDLWPVFFGTMTAVYCTLTIRAFLQRRKQLNQIMASNSDLNFNRYFRLMGLAAVNMLFVLPLGIYTMVVNASTPIYVWRGLADLHYDFSAVDQYPAIVWRSSALAQRSVMFSEWSYIGCALLSFGFFGFGDEARKHYRKIYDVVTKHFGVRPAMWQRLPERWRMRSKPAGPPPISIALPSFAPTPKRDTLYSTSGKISISISLTDVGPDGNVLDKPLPPPSLCTSGSHYSTDSDTYVSSEKDEKGEKRESPLPPLPLDDPDFVLDIRRMTVLRPAPDVPTSVRHSMDIV